MVKQMAVNYFVEIVEDKDIQKINRDGALKFYRFWVDCIAPAKGVPTHSASRG